MWPCGHPKSIHHTKRQGEKGEQGEDPTIDHLKYFVYGSLGSVEQVVSDGSTEPFPVGGSRFGS